RALLLPAFGLRVGRGHGNARHRGHPLHGFRKAQAIKLGQKAEVIARSPASEAVIAPLAVLAMKTRRLLPMEGTAGPVAAPRRIRLALVEGDAAAHHLAYGHAISDLVEKTVGKAHGPGVLRCPSISDSPLLRESRLPPCPLFTAGYAPPCAGRSQATLATAESFLLVTPRRQSISSSGSAGEKRKPCSSSQPACLS